MLLKWYNLTWSVGYIFPEYLARENLCKAVRYANTGRFCYLYNVKDCKVKKIKIYADNKSRLERLLRSLHKIDFTS